MRPNRLSQTRSMTAAKLAHLNPAVAGEGWRCDRPAERETNETMRKDEKIED